MRIGHESTLTSSLLLALAVLGLAACAHDGGGSGPTAKTTSAAVSVDDAAGELAKAHCERQAECNSLGGQAFSTRTECREAVARDERRNLNAAPCTVGVDKPQVDKCVEILRAEVCLGNMGEVESMVECSAKRLCAH